MSDQRIYLDSAATTAPYPGVKERMKPYLSEQYANPSSLHSPAREVRTAIEDVRRDIAEELGCDSRELVFTSGGTEANNLAVVGLARGNREKGNHIICTSIEHRAVLTTCRRLTDRGFEVTEIPAGKDGSVSPDAIEKAIRNDTVLVSVMLANNETGAIQPVREIAKITQKKGIPLHTDAVQAFGKMEKVFVPDLAVDALSLSAHKIHGPKGAGLLFVREGVPIDPVLTGGDQEGGRRAGTENVPAIMGFHEAFQKTVKHLEKNISHMEELGNRLREGLRENVPEMELNSSSERSLPNILNVSFPGVEGETMVIMLDREGISASTGSACETDSVETSHVLRAMSLSDKRARSAVRFSLSSMNSMEEMDAVLDIIPDVYRKAKQLSG